MVEITRLRRGRRSETRRARGNTDKDNEDYRTLYIGLQQDYLEKHCEEALCRCIAARRAWRVASRIGRLGRRNLKGLCPQKLF